MRPVYASTPLESTADLKNFSDASSRALSNGNLMDRPRERPIFKGFAFLAAVSAHGSIASSLAISFASRVA